ncbi:MAG: hypothetical protein ACFE9D_04550 [Promethearchaeota archaeon]
MTDESSDQLLKSLKCSECGAKITPESLQLGSPIICEYCGTINVPPTSPSHQQVRTRAARHPWMRARRGPQRVPILLTTRLLIEKGSIDEKILRKYTKQNIDKRMRPSMALRRALRQMRDEGKLNQDKILRAVDELIAEKKLSPIIRMHFFRLFE